MTESQVRVRFAPSPTGYLHIGGARTALYNWLYAQKVGGVFVLRIEDTDAARSTEESYQTILDALNWLGLQWDEGPNKGGPFGPYIQSARQVLYHTEAQTLIDRGMAYRCFCTPEELDEMREEATKKGEAIRYDRRCRNLPADEVESRMMRKTQHVLRFKMPPGETSFRDLIRGPITFNNDELDDYVMIKSDGKPTYNFAAAVDDAKMRISHVIRGDDHLSNTPKQILIYKALDYPIPKFAHLPMILGTDRSRLSKRHGAVSVQEYRRMGYLSDAMVNYLALLGWSYDDKTDFFTRDGLIEKFSLKRVGKNQAAFDPDKLNHINGEHFKTLSLIRKAALTYQKLGEKNILPADFTVKEWQGAHLDNGAGEMGGGAEAIENHGFREELPRLAIILKVLGNRLKNVKDAPGMMAYFYRDSYTVDPAAVDTYLSDASVADLLRRIAGVLEDAEPFDRGQIEQSVRDLAETLGVEASALIHPCRVSLTGQRVSPDIFSVIHLLGREKCVERLIAAAEKITAAAKG
jgi:glutamyl-tRNA synthetase